MKGKMNTDLGQVLISPEVITKYAGTTACECLVKLLKRDSLSKGINVTIDENNEISIEFHVIIAYGVNISTIAENIISSVKYKVEAYTGMTVKKINIYVEGVRVID